jgi:excisionase family DNA binding protein
MGVSMLEIPGTVLPCPQARVQPFLKKEKDMGSSRPASIFAERMLFTAEEAAQYLCVSRTTLFALLASGELESVKIGRSRRVPHAALTGYVERLRAEAA